MLRAVATPNATIAVSLGNTGRTASNAGKRNAMRYESTESG
jgi:hypothetical protein